MTADRFALPWGKNVRNSHEEAVHLTNRPSGLSETFGLPYWQLNQVVKAPTQDRFIRQTHPIPVESPSGGDAKTPLAQATQTMQEHLKGWLNQNPDLLEALQDPSKKAPSDASLSGKKKKRKSTSIEIGETEFSCKTSSGKEPAKCQTYSPYGDMSESEEAGDSGGDYSSEDYSGGDFSNHDSGSYSAPDTSYTPDTSFVSDASAVMDYGHDGGMPDYGGSEADFSGDSD